MCCRVAFVTPGFYTCFWCCGLESGIIDPAKVTRSALQNAAMILTTEALIKDLPEKEKPAFPAMQEY